MLHSDKLPVSTVSFLNNSTCLLILTVLRIVTYIELSVIMLVTFKAYNLE